MEAEKLRIVYERRSCTRCGGSGHYSYCSMHGTTCFKCGGSKKIISRAGAKARALIHALQAELCAIPASEVRVGDRLDLSWMRARVIRIEPSGPDSICFIHREGSGEAGYIVRRDSKVMIGPKGEAWEKIVALARTIKKGVSIEELTAKGAAR